MNGVLKSFNDIFRHIEEDAKPKHCVLNAIEYWAAPLERLHDGQVKSKHEKRWHSMLVKRVNDDSDFNRLRTLTLSVSSHHEVNQFEIGLFHCLCA